MESGQPGILLNLDAVHGQMASSIIASIEHVTLGLAAVNKMLDGPIVLPGAFFQVSKSDGVNSSPDSRSAFELWLLGIGLREGIGALEPFLTEIRYAAGLCTYFESNKGLKVPIGGTLDEILAEVRERELRGFPRKPWNQKLDILERILGTGIQLRDDFESICRARNCLTHRRGLVGPEDVDKSHQLTVKYRSMDVMDISPEGEAKCINASGYTVEAGHVIALRRAPVTKMFALGETVQFSSQEFVVIMLTLHWFGSELVKTVAEYAVARGMPQV